MRPTLSTFRAQFPSEAMGVCQADPQVAAYANDSQERLLMDQMAPDEGWWGGWVTLNLSAFSVNGSAYVTTPREIARLIVMDVCKHPIRIRNGFYEYLQFGAGLQPKGCKSGSCGQTFQAYERNSVVTFTDLLPTPQKIRVYPTDTRDIGFRVLINGKDQNGQVVLSTDANTGTSIPGEYLAVAFPFADSLNQFSTPLLGIQKDQTYGPLQFFQVDPTTGVEMPLSTMDPNEASAGYRRYMISGIPSLNPCCSPANPLQISAQGRLDFIPVIAETDYLTIQCVPALVEESLSIRYSRMDSANSAKQSVEHHARALALLNGQLDTFQGKTNTAVSMPIFGSNRMRPSFR